MKNAKGFTLIELLIVIAIIGILASLAITAFSKKGHNTVNTYRAETSNTSDGDCKEIGSKLAQNQGLSPDQLDFYSKNKNCVDNYTAKYKSVLGK